MKEKKREGFKKDIALESVRGIASLVVLVFHCIICFLPKKIGHVGIFNDYGISPWQSSPLFFLVNGPAAVALFFVLSGYILTREYFYSGDINLIIKRAIKRYPRLIGPVLATTLISWALFQLDFYSFKEAGAAAGSSFLSNFGYVLPGIPSPASFQEAFFQGAFFTFFQGGYSYDSTLWTMHSEFIGSFMAFGMAPILLAGRKISIKITLLLIGCIILPSHFARPYPAFSPVLITFPMGVALALFLPRTQQTSKIKAIVLLFLAFYLLGYSGVSKGFYSMLTWFDHHQNFQIYISAIGAVLLIALVEAVSSWHLFLSNPLWSWLGELSFPLYLIHPLVLFSVGSVVYLHYGTTAAMITTIIGSFIAALPILMLNRVWLSYNNRFIELFFPAPKRKEPTE